MKKYLLGIFFGLFVIVILLFLYDYTKFDYGVREFEHIFNQTLPNKVVSEKLYDSHEGIHYDGESLYQFSFSEESADEFISKVESSDSWKPLPLSESLSLLMFGGEKNDIEYMHFFAEIVGLPEVNNGYWMFVNQNIDDSNLLDAYSYDFSLAIFDVDHNMMYFVKINT